MLSFLYTVSVYDYANSHCFILPVKNTAHLYSVLIYDVQCFIINLLSYKNILNLPLPQSFHIHNPLSYSISHGITY